MANNRQLFLLQVWSGVDEYFMLGCSPLESKAAIKQQKGESKDSDLPYIEIDRVSVIKDNRKRRGDNVGQYCRALREEAGVWSQRMAALPRSVRTIQTEKSSNITSRVPGSACSGMLISSFA